MCLGRNLYQTGDDELTVRQEIMRLRLVLGILGKLLRREGAYPRVVEMFYMALVQTILLYGLGTWVHLAAM